MKIVFFQQLVNGLTLGSAYAVIAIGYTRLVYIFAAYPFTMIYEMLSGYLRGFGISLAPAVLTLFGVCGVRIFWIKAIFPMHRTFRSILLAYPISLVTTAVPIFIALLIYRPSRRFAAAHSKINPQVTLTIMLRCYAHFCRAIRIF